MKSSLFVAIATLMLILIMVFPSLVDAKVKIRSGSNGGMLLKTGLKASMHGNYRSYSSYSSDDRAWCESGDDMKSTYICDSSAELTLGLKQEAMNEAKEQVTVASITVDEYSRSSVDYYNSLVRASNSAVADYNSKLESECVQLELWCKPMTCQAKYPGTSYKNDSDSCVCENGMAWDTVTQCKSPSPTTNSTGTSQESSSKGSDNSFLGLVIVCLIGWFLYSMFKKG